MLYLPTKFENYLKGKIFSIYLAIFIYWTSKCFFLTICSINHEKALASKPMQAAWCMNHKYCKLVECELILL